MISDSDSKSPITNRNSSYLASFFFSAGAADSRCTVEASLSCFTAPETEKVVFPSFMALSISATTSGGLSLSSFFGRFARSSFVPEGAVSHSPLSSRETSPVILTSMRSRVNGPTAFLTAVGSNFAFPGKVTA